MSGTPQTRHIGSSLKAAREAAGISSADLAHELGVDRSTVIRWENGSRSIREEMAERYLDVVDADDTTIADVLRTTRQADDALWVTWARGTDRRRSAAALLQAEQSALRIHWVTPLHIPAPLQAPEWARAIMQGAGVPENELHNRVAERLGRWAMLDSLPTPPHIDVYLDEAVLRRPIGGPDVLKQQLDFLLERSKLERVNLMIVPLTSTRNPLIEGQFELIESGGENTIVYQETREVILFFNSPAEVDSYRSVIEAAKKVAMSVEESRELIAEIAKEMDQL